MKRMPAVIAVVAAAMILWAPVNADSTFPEPEGWKSNGEIQSFGRDNLWEYIDGAADAFLAYGFLGLRVADLSAGDLLVSVELYDMGTPLNAFGIYRSEFPEGRATVAAGAEGAVVPPYQCLLLKGEFYVKVEILEGEVTPESGEAFLKALAAALPGEDNLPVPLQALPETDRVAGSEGYARESYLGFSELGNSVHASYRGADGKEYTLFLLVPGEEETPEAVWARLSERWRPVEREGAQVRARRIPYGGTAAVILTGDGVLGVSGMSDTAAATVLLDSIVR